jgi:hypothetical protein
MVSNKSLLESSKLQAMTPRDFLQLQRDLETAGHVKAQEGQ